MGSFCCTGGNGMLSNEERARELKLRMLLQYLEADKDYLKSTLENKFGHRNTTAL